MTNATQISIADTCSTRTDQTPYSLDGNFKSERSAYRTGREYLPMDVFVDPKTMGQHFQGSFARPR